MIMLFVLIFPGYQCARLISTLNTATYSTPSMQKNAPSDSHCPVQALVSIGSDVPAFCALRLAIKS